MGSTKNLVPGKVEVRSEVEKKDVAQREYRRPEVHELGKLEQVQAGSGYYYDGPNTTWLRY